MKKASNNSWLSHIPIYIGIFFLTVIAVITVSVIAKLAFVWWIYNFFSGMVMSTFGLDIVLARGIGVFLTVVSLLLLPIITSFILFGKKKREVLIISAVAFGVFSVSIYYSANDVFFDRQTGSPLKYYIKTLDGFKFSNSNDFDPQLNIKYKPIDAQTAKEYYLWQKTGELQIPKVKPGKYFDRLTGEPIVWYAEREEGTIELFGLPGFDELTGEPLKPITKDVINKNLTSTSNFTRKIIGQKTILEGGYDYVVDIPNKVFSKKVYELEGYILEKYSFADNNVREPNKSASIFLDKIFFLENYTVIGLKIPTILSKSPTIDFPLFRTLLLDELYGVQYSKNDIFFVKKRPNEYRYINGHTVLEDNIPITEDRILLLIFDFIEPELFLESRMYLSIDLHVNSIPVIIKQ